MRTWIKALAGLAVGAATGAVLFYGRGFFIGHAALVGIAAGALVYTALGTSERLGRMYRRRGPRSIRRRDE